MSKKLKVVDETVTRENVVHFVESALTLGRPAHEIRSTLAGLYRETAVTPYATNRERTTYVSMMLACSALERLEQLVKATTFTPIKSKPSVTIRAKKKLTDQLRSRRK